MAYGLEEFLNLLIQKNSAFISQAKDSIQEFSKKQTPEITFVTCSDSRVGTEYLQLENLNKVFVIRNIGNSVEYNFGSVEYGVEHLNTPILLIMGHTNCGAVNATLFHYDESSPEIKRELDTIKPALQGINETDPEKKRVKGVEKNLEYQVNLAKEKFQEKIDNGELVIIGGILDLDNSYGEGYGKFHIKHIVGDKEKIKLEKID